jgi:OFA family oxalate/formate antiporter-like MFS transporter
MTAETTTNKGWIVVAAGTGLNLALGMLYSWSVINAYISAPAIDVKTGLANTTTWGVSAQNGIMPYALALIVFAFVMIFAGRAQDKFGPRIVATIGGAMMGLGMIVSSFASKDMFWPLILGFGVLGGAGIGLGYASATPAAVKWFALSKKGLITGIVVAGFGLASVYVSPLTSWLLKGEVDFYFFKIKGLALGVNQTFLILGIFFFIVTILFAQFLKNPPKGYVLPVAAPKKDEAAKPAAADSPAKKVDYTWQEMLKIPQYYVLFLMYAFVSFAGLMIIGHIAKIYVFQAPTAVPLGFLLVAILAIGNASGRIIAGMVSDKIGRTYTMAMFFLSQAVFMGLLYLSGTPAALALCAFGVGFNYGANLTLFPATTADFFGIKNMGVNYGLVFFGWGVGGALGSLAAGWIVDATKTTAVPTGSYTIAYAIAAGLCVLAAIMTFLLKAPKHADLEPSE